MIASVVAVLISATVASAYLLPGKRYVDRELSKAVSLNSEWLELTPAEPLTVEGDTQELTLFPDPPIQMVADKGLVPANGRVADIEAELVDNNGVAHRASRGRSETMSGDLKITSRSLVFKDLPRDVTYKTVRLKSSEVYPVKKILWRCYNWSDVRQ